MKWESLNQPHFCPHCGTPTFNEMCSDCTVQRKNPSGTRKAVNQSLLIKFMKERAA